MTARELHDKFEKTGISYMQELITSIRIDSKFIELKEKYLNAKSENKSNTKASDTSSFPETTTYPDVYATYEDLNLYYNSQIVNHDLIKGIQDLFNELVVKSDEEEYYFYACNSRTAINYYKKYIKEKIDPVFDIDKKKICLELNGLLGQIESELDFGFELNVLNNSIEDIEESEHLHPYMFLSLDQIDFIKTSLYKQETFLKKEGGIKEPDWDKEYSKLQIGKEKAYDLLTDNEPLNTNSWEKILYLSELGLIDYLRNECLISNEGIGRILAKIIPGNNPKTLARYVGKFLTERNIYSPENYDDKWKQVRHFLKGKGVKMND